MGTDFLSKCHSVFKESVINLKTQKKLGEEKTGQILLWATPAGKTIFYFYFNDKIPLFNVQIFFFVFVIPISLISW